MFKYYLVVLCYFILKIHADKNITRNTVLFDSTKGFKVNYVNTSDGKVDVTYDCSDSKKNNETSLKWFFGDYPVNTQSLTIQNCKLKLMIGSGGDVRKNEAMLKEMTNTKYEHFKKLAFKNILDLTIGPLLSGLQFVMKKDISVSVENVDNMRILPKELISSTPNGLKYNDNMGRFNFTMNNVNIEEVETEAIDWRKRDIPIDLIWSNVKVKNIKTGAIKMHSYGVQYPLGKIDSYPENNVYIMNCSFDKLPTNTVIGLTKNFVFVNNRVADIGPSAFNITSQNMTLIKNEFDNIDEYAFHSLSKGKNASLTFNSNVIKSSNTHSISFGAHDSKDADDNTISIHENKFKCINSSWLVEQRNETRNNSVIANRNVTSSYVSKYERILLKNQDNVCYDDEFENSYVSVQRFYQKYPNYKDSWSRYPEKPGSPISPFIFTLIILVTLAVIAVMGFYLYKRKK